MSSNLRKIITKIIFIRKKHIFVFFFDKMIFLCFYYINSHIRVLWWRHTFIHVRFIAFLCVCVCVVFVGVVFVRCGKAQSKRVSTTQWKRSVTIATRRFSCSSLWKNGGPCCVLVVEEAVGEEGSQEHMSSPYLSQPRRCGWILYYF